MDRFVVNKGREEKGAWLWWCRSAALNRTPTQSEIDANTEAIHKK